MSDLAILIIGTVVLGIVLTSTLMGFLGTAGSKEMLSASRNETRSNEIAGPDSSPLRQPALVDDFSGTHLKLRAQA